MKITSKLLLSVGILAGIRAPAQVSTNPIPPAPKVAPSLLSIFQDVERGIRISYPPEFHPGSEKELHETMERGHILAFGTAPESDPEHREVERCVHPLLYATAESMKAGIASTDATVPSEAHLNSDSLLVLDFNSTCVPHGIKGDQVLSGVSNSLLKAPGFTSIVSPVWFDGPGKRRIHAGLSETTMNLPIGATDQPSQQMKMYILASVFETKKHLILVAYLCDGKTQHPDIPSTDVQFESGLPVYLFPFLREKMNIVP